MPQFRKKPIVIEAVQWFPGTKHPGVVIEDYHPAVSIEDRRAYVITIHEQRSYLAPGDWIIPEPKDGRFYPCKAAIFEQTYEPVNATA